jgi:hypothetical protein
LKQLETAVNWGRYAEIFTYDPERGTLRLYLAYESAIENIQDHG